MKSTAEGNKISCSVACNLCGGDIVEEIGMMDRTGEYLRSVICKSCGLSWSDPRPNEDEIRKYYSKDYRISYKGTYTPTFKHVYRAGKVALDRYAFAKTILKENDVVLDVGAGGGEFVYLMDKLGYDVNGIEPNEGYGTFARDTFGLSIQIGFIQQADLQNSSYNVVTMHHVLEHLDDPFAVLQKLHRAIREEGFLIIEVPNIEAVCSGPKSRFHSAHLYNFNRQNLETMGRRAGFLIYKTAISQDGGVITTIFQKSEKSGAVECEIPENFRRISTIVRRHAKFSHYLSPNPYVRPIRKLQRYFDESRAIDNCNNAEEILLKLCAKVSSKS